MLVDTLGLMLRVVVRPASVQSLPRARSGDRDGIALVLDRRTRRRYPFIDVVFADQGYQGPKAAAAVAATGNWRLEIVRRDPGVRGFEVLPERWIVERNPAQVRGRPLSWLRRNRRLARDFEHLVRTAEAFVTLAMIKIMLRRLACR